MAKIDLQTRPSSKTPLFRVRLSRMEASVVAGVPDRLVAAFADPERNRKVIGRLFPPAFDRSEAEQDAHRALLGSMLLDERRAAVAATRKLIASGESGLRGLTLRLTAQELETCLMVINDYRVLLATELDIRDNDWVERGPARIDDHRSFLELVVLSGIEECFLEGLSGSLDGLEGIIAE